MGVAPPSAVVRIYAEDAETRSSGSGTLIGPDLVITCNHVVKDRSGSTVEVHFPNWDVVVGEVIKSDKDYDLALIKLKQPRSEKPPALGALKRNDKVTIHGYAYGPYLSQEGEYYIDDKTGKWGLIRGAQARQGDSGGTVMRGSEFVGVLWGARPNETWFTPIDNILKAFPELKDLQQEEEPEKPDYVIEDIDYSL